MKITDEIRAQVYRELADDIDDHSLLSAENLRKRAEEKDPPRPKPGPIVFESGIRGMVLQGSSSLECKYDIVTEYGELLMFEDAMPWKPARILGPDEVTVKVPPVSEWPRSAMGVGVYYENDRGLIDPIQYITRAEAEAMEVE